MGDDSAFVFKTNTMFLGYFDHVNVIFDIENKLVSGQPNPVRTAALFSVNECRTSSNRIVVYFDP